MGSPFSSGMMGEFSVLGVEMLVRVGQVGLGGVIGSLLGWEVCSRGSVHWA